MQNAIKIISLLCLIFIIFLIVKFLPNNENVDTTKDHRIIDSMNTIIKFKIDSIDSIKNKIIIDYNSDSSKIEYKYIKIKEHIKELPKDSAFMLLIHNLEKYEK